MREDDMAEDVPAGWSLRSSRYPTQQALIARIRQGDDDAIRHLFTLYAPMLREEARKLSVPAADRDHLVCTLLDDIAMRFMDSPIVPAALTTYVVRTLRNRVRTHHRNPTRERATDQNAYAAYGSSSEMVIAECHSEYGMRTSTGSGGDQQSHAGLSLKNLAVVLAACLSREDRVLITGVDRHIPLRELAQDLGVSHGAARVRLSRLRERIGKVAVAYVDSLPSAQKSELGRFLRRANVTGSRKPTEPSGADRSPLRPVQTEDKS